MKLFFKIVLFILVFLLFLGLYSRFLFEVFEILFPSFSKSDFVDVLVPILSFVITFFKMYLLNKWYENKILS